jgi:hypothetical protein
MNKLLCWAGLAAALCAAGGAWAQSAAPGEPVIAQYSLDTSVRLMSDRRSRGISDSYRRPAAELHVEAAHASGLVGVFEVGTVSRHVYPESDGFNLLVAAGYRWGNPDGWHFGVGAAHERFPGAHFEAPTAIEIVIDPGTGMPALAPAGVRDFNFTTSYAVLEFGYGALEARYLNVLSRDFRGINTGMVCGTLLLQREDPTSGLDCFARGDHGSRGSHLLDLDWQHPIDGRTWLLLHGGIQRVKHFSEANGWDWRAGVKHSRWGVDWTLEAVGARMKTRELFIGFDGSGGSKRLDGTGVVFTVAKTF